MTSDDARPAAQGNASTAFERGETVTVAVTRETLSRILFQLGSFASLIESHPEMTTTTADHIDSLASTLRDEVHAADARTERANR